MRIDGEEYRLDINGMAGHLNGGVKGFAGRLWESRVETNRVVMSLSSDDGDQGYPGNLQVEAAFDFDEDNALEITYIARTDRTTPVNMACNLLLNLGGEGSGSVLDHEPAARCFDCFGSGRSSDSYRETARCCRYARRFPFTAPLG